METAPDTQNLIKEFFNAYPYMDFFIRYVWNLLVIFWVVGFIYYPRHKNKDFLFTFLLFNTVIFLICYLLSSEKIKIGFALGLFAVFSILRYRTVTVPVREMGYFFVSITLGLINSLSQMNDPSSITVLVVANLIVVAMVWLLDRQMGLEHENFKTINYERIDLIKPELREEMLEDLRKRTGLPIHRVEIVRIDFLRDVARVNAFYYSLENETSSYVLTEDD
ncbi:MAG: DUF4956 domain-containing protein [Chitinophagales bacterium]|nr:DUF4956 domain-containing protein [Chitinophagales bacterium]MDW8417959.1 DUF4956 domain-containing protein [Chitinophagales bacterium]